MFQWRLIYRNSMLIAAWLPENGIFSVDMSIGLKRHDFSLICSNRKRPLNDFNRIRGLPKTTSAAGSQAVNPVSYHAGDNA